MKISKFAAIGIMALTGAALIAQDPPAAQPAGSGTPEIKLNLPQQAEPALSDDQVIVAFGWLMAHQTGLVALGFSKEEIAKVAQGMSLAVAGEPLPAEMANAGPAIQQLIAARRTSALTKMRNQGLAESEKFFSELRTKPGVVSLGDGLAYEVLKEGDGPIPRVDQTVAVYYTGRLINGDEFDHTQPPDEPAKFVLNSVIPGWTEGISKLKKGTKAMLYVPPHLGYGDRGAAEIPPGSTLIFEVELVDVMDTPPGAANGDKEDAEPPAANAAKQ